jgi:hypothetical protein
MYSGTLQRPESNRKKNVIIAAIIVVVCFSAFGGLYYMFKGNNPEDRSDEFGPPRREWRDSNLPNPNKQEPQEIMAYMDSAKFKKLGAREQFEYMREGSRKVMEYQMETYFSLPTEQRTAYLDSVIDRMQTQRGSFEQMRRQMPPRHPPDANDPNRPARRERASQRMTQGQGGPGGNRRAPNPSRMRARSERGTALQRAQREAFMEAMRARMQQRGISMSRRGGGGPGGRGGPGSP